MKRSSLCALFTLVLAVVIAVGSVSFLGPCIHEDESFGACHWAGQALFGLGLLLAAESLFTLLVKDLRMRQGCLVTIWMTAVLGFFIPGTLIDLCSMATMRCVALMQPAMRILCALIVLIALIGTISGGRKAGKQE